MSEWFFRVVAWWIAESINAFGGVAAEIVCALAGVEPPLFVPVELVLRPKGNPWGRKGRPKDVMNGESQC